MTESPAAKRNRVLTQAAQRAEAPWKRISIRELIGLWGYQRRGYYVVQQVRGSLAEHGLRTEPDFERGWIDEKVELVRLPEEVKEDHADVEDLAIPGSDSQVTEASFMAGALTFADLDEILFPGGRAALTAVSPDDTLAKAQSLMMAFDYSQLPVMIGRRTFKGAVSWESIAKTIAHRPAAIVADCLMPADALKLSDDVLTNVPKITQNGFILTKNDAQEIVGIVTTADLAVAFEALAGPFLLLGICEQLLRNVAASNFEEDVIRELGDQVSVERAVDGLTLGELKTLFDSGESWAKLNWHGVDATTFRSSLGDIVSFRNRVMHFRGGWSRQEERAQVRNMITWLRLLGE